MCAEIEMMARGEHHHAEGFKTIVRLAYKMNEGGKRRRVNAATIVPSRGLRGS